MPVRIYDLAKKLGLESKEVLAKAKELGISAAKVPSSSLDKITAEYLEEQLAPRAAQKHAEVAATVPTPLEASPAPPPPVVSPPVEVSTAPQVELGPAAETPEVAPVPEIAPAPVPEIVRPVMPPSVSPEAIEVPPLPEIPREPLPAAEPIAAKVEPIQPPVAPPPAPAAPVPPPPPATPQVGEKIGFIQLPQKPA